MRKDTPPASPNMDDLHDIDEMNEDDVVYFNDIDEVLDSYEAGQSEEEQEEDMEEDTPQKGDSTCVFTAHKPGSVYSIRVGSVFCGTLSKDGKLAATGGEEDRAYVWNTESGEIVLDCTGHKDSVIFAEFNFDESYLATGDMSGIIQVWQINDKKVIWEYNMGDAIWMKWHMAANVLFAGSVDGLVYMWKVPQGDCKIFQGHGYRAEVGAIMPDGKRIVVGYKDGAIKVIDLKTGSIQSSILPNMGHDSTVTALDCHTDNNLIVSAAIDGKTILSTAQGKIISVLQDLNNKKENNIAKSTQETERNILNADSNWVETVAFCKAPGFQVLATGTLNGEIFIWDISKQILRQQIDQEKGMSKLLWKGTTSLLFSAGLDGILRCFDARNNQCVRSFRGHTADILDLHISGDESTVLTTSDDSTARVFDIQSLT